MSSTMVNGHKPTGTSSRKCLCLIGVKGRDIRVCVHVTEEKMNSLVSFWSAREGEIHSGVSVLCVS